MTQQDIIGKTLYCTSIYALNLPFHVVGRYLNDSVEVNTWEGRNSVSKRPMGRITKAVYSNQSIFDMIEQGILSTHKL